MAFTINRNNEISPADLDRLKEIFKVSTNTQAVYKAVNFAALYYEKITKILELKEKFKNIIEYANRYC